MNRFQNLLSISNCAATPRTALTEADTNAQRAIVSALQATWPGLRIVGEEEREEEEGEGAGASDSGGDGGGGGGGGSADSQLRRDLISAAKTSAGEEDSSPRKMTMGIQQLEAWEEPLDVLTVFVDPVDGTREFVVGVPQGCHTRRGVRGVSDGFQRGFIGMSWASQGSQRGIWPCPVEGRLGAVQCLIGVACRGRAVAGAIGLPFPGGASDAGALPVVTWGIAPPGAHRGVTGVFTGNNDTGNTSGTSGDDEALAGIEGLCSTNYISVTYMIEITRASVFVMFTNSNSCDPVSHNPSGPERG